MSAGSLPGALVRFPVKASNWQPVVGLMPASNNVGTDAIPTTHLRVLFLPASFAASSDCQGLPSLAGRASAPQRKRSLGITRTATVMRRMVAPSNTKSLGPCPRNWQQLKPGCREPGKVKSVCCDKSAQAVDLRRRSLKSIQKAAIKVASIHKFKSVLILSSGSNG